MEESERKKDIFNLLEKEEELVNNIEELAFQNKKEKYIPIRQYVNSKKKDLQISKELIEVAIEDENYIDETIKTITEEIEYYEQVMEAINNPDKDIIFNLHGDIEICYKSEKDKIIEKMNKEFIESQEKKNEEQEVETLEANQEVPEVSNITPVDIQEVPEVNNITPVDIQEVPNIEMPTINESVAAPVNDFNSSIDQAGLNAFINSTEAGTNKIM